MNDKRASRGYRSQPSQPSARPSSDMPAKDAFTAIAPHLRTWPTPPKLEAAPKGEHLLLEDRAWLEAVGKPNGISTFDEVQRMYRSGHLPAVRLSDLPDDAYPFKMSEASRRKVFVLTKPDAVRADPGPLKAVVFTTDDGHPVRVPTSVRAGLYDDEDKRNKAAAAAIAEADKALGKSKDIYRIAWLAERDGRELVRVIDYRDGKGRHLEDPGKRDLEAIARAYDRTPDYSSELLRQDTARALAPLLPAYKPIVQPEAPEAPAATTPTDRKSVV
jgi:hypothetical protein